MPSSFRFDVESNGLATLVFDMPGSSANVFTRETMAELASIVEVATSEPDIRCLVLTSAKPRIFIAGADIEGIAGVTESAEAEAGARMGQRIFSAWASLPFPTVAAINGSCAGGGTELALACDMILLSNRPDLRIGLPETRLGIVPGWGGCTRLPRKVGLAAALDIILGGRMVRPRKAFKIGLADALVPAATFLSEVRRIASGISTGTPGRRRRTRFGTTLLEGNSLGRKIVFDQARKRALEKSKGHYPAPLRAIEVVKVGLEDGIEAGLDAEARAIGELAVSPVCKNLVHLFRLMETAKDSAGGADQDVPEVGSVAVLGAGVMGGGIAQIVADKADVPVRLKDVGTGPLALGMRHAGDLFAKQVRKRWISRAEADRKMALIRPTLDYTGFRSTDLVVEAIVEDLDVKQKVFAEIGNQVRSDAILASNTSSLSIDLIARDTASPERVVGMHFFNPVHKMPLVEVVVGDLTSRNAIEAVVGFSRRLGKTPVVVKNGPGFLVNRLLAFTLAEAMWLLDDGLEIGELDRIASSWGLPMGPAELTDEVGIDVAAKVAHIMTSAFPERLSYPDWMDRLSEDGRHGAKTEKGFYRYSKGKRTDPDPAVYAIIGSAHSSATLRPEQVTDRLILPMVNEAARCLAEGIVASAGELDLAMILGTGFPPFRGGLCRWADGQGVGDLRAAMERLAADRGKRFAPAGAFSRVVESGGFYAAFPRTD